MLVLLLFIYMVGLQFIEEVWCASHLGKHKVLISKVDLFKQQRPTFALEVCLDPVCL